MDQHDARGRLNDFIAQYLGTPNQIVDAHEVCIRAGSAAIFIRHHEHDPRFVRVFSPMVRDVPESAELLQELNAMNGTGAFARVFWRDSTVWVATEHLIETLDLDELVNACDVVSEVADHHDDRLMARFGGHMSFDDAS